MKNIIINTISRYLNVLAIVAPKKAGKVGFNMFCRPFRSKITDKQMSFFNSAEQLSIQHKSDTVKIYKWGNGPRKVLFLHGWQSHTYRWKAYIESLDKDKFSAYAFDAPGHGLSTGSFMSMPLYSEVMERVIKLIDGVETVVGHSIGGFTALYTFFRHPGLKAQKMVLMAPPGEAQDFFNFFQQTLKLSDKFLDLSIRQFTEMFNRGPEYFSAPKFAEGLSIPGLVIHDEEDDETPLENSIRITNNWPNSRLIVTKGTGHNLKSREVLYEVVNFINKPVLAEPVEELVSA